MPACVAFDPGTHIFNSQSTRQYHETLYHSSDIDYLDPKSFGASIYPFKFKASLLSHQSLSPDVPSFSPFDSVPYEILDQILESVHGDTTRGIYDVLRDISACCLVSRQFHAVAVNWLYRHVPISDPYAFTKVSQLTRRTLIYTVFITNFPPSREGHVGKDSGF
jgi:F-box-like